MRGCLPGELPANWCRSIRSISRTIPLEHIRSNVELYGVELDDVAADELGVITGSAMLKDETRCIRCGLCAERCPVDVITMEAYTWVEPERGLIPPQSMYGEAVRANGALDRSGRGRKLEPRRRKRLTTADEGRNVMEDTKTSRDGVRGADSFIRSGLGSLCVAGGGAAVFGYQFLSPNVLYEPSPIANVGKPDRFPPDSVTRGSDGGRLHRARPEGFYALSATCTHLGCLTAWKPELGIIACPATAANSTGWA